MVVYTRPEKITTSIILYEEVFFLSFLKSFVVEKIFWDIAPRLMTYTEGVSPVVTNILSSNKSELF